MTFVTIPTAPGGLRPTFVYFSERGIPLVYNSAPPPVGKMIVTVENYLKWYDLYSIDELGQVKTFDPNHDLVEFWDHVPHPQQLGDLDYEEHHGVQLILDSEAWDMVLGRFFEENRRLQFTAGGDVQKRPNVFALLDSIGVDNEHHCQPKENLN